MENKYDLAPYTMEEIDARIAQAESELESGLGIPSDVVFEEMRKLVMRKL